MRFFKLLMAFFPRGFREKLISLVSSANPRDPESFAGLVLFLSFILSLLFATLISTFLGWNFFFVAIVLFIIFISSIYLYLIVSLDMRVKLIEELLPDALQLMASNLRAGISIEKALLLAARPEFGPLEVEIHRVAKEVATGKDFGKALKDMSIRTRSRAIERVVDLIISGLRSGGKLSTLLENSAQDLSIQRIVKQKIRSNVEIYIIFIFIAAGIGAPLLFALSLFLVKVMIQNFGNIDIPASAASTLPITIGKINISTDFLLKYIMTSLLTTSVLASFMLGMIAKGKAKEGAKYIVILALLSISLFFVTGLLLTSFFSGLFGS